MKYDYILHSVNFPDQYYTGLADNLKTRIAKHNAKEVPHTSKKEINFAESSSNLAFLFKTGHSF